MTPCDLPPPPPLSLAARLAVLRARHTEEDADQVRRRDAGLAIVEGLRAELPAPFEVSIRPGEGGREHVWVIIPGAPARCSAGPLDWPEALERTIASDAFAEGLLRIETLDRERSAERIRDEDEARERIRASARRSEERAAKDLRSAQITLWIALALAALGAVGLALGAPWEYVLAWPLAALAVAALDGLTARRSRRDAVRLRAEAEGSFARE